MENGEVAVREAVEEMGVQEGQGRGSNNLGTDHR